MIVIGIADRQILQASPLQEPLCATTDGVTFASILTAIHYLEDLTVILSTGDMQFLVNKMTPHVAIDDQHHVFPGPDY
jgi:hypothetical protein